MTVPVYPLRRSLEFRTVSRQGRKWVAPAFVFLVWKRDDTAARYAPCTEAVQVGFTVTRKLGNAVKRNRIKRRLRALARWTVLSYPALAGHDLVFIGRPATIDHDYAAMQKDMHRAMKRFGFVDETP